MRGLFVAGPFLIVAGMVVLEVGLAGQGTVSSGGFVFIRPVPIILGTGPSGGQLAGLALIVGVLMLVLIALLTSRLRS